MPHAENRLKDNLILWLYLPVVLALGVCIALPLYDWALGSDSSLAQALMRKGPEKLTRRCTMVVALVFLPLVLRTLHWSNWRECGWRHAAGRTGAARDFRNGLIMGLGIMLVLFIVSLVAGTRTWHVAYPLPKLLFSLFSYFFAAIVVGVLEETVARGVIFRLLIQRWPVVPVLLLVAVIFAWVHFLKATPEAYESASYFDRVSTVLGSSFTGFLRDAEAGPRMTNLALFSIALCLLYLRTGSVWLPAGLHAGVVYIKRMNSILADSNHAHSWAGLTGNSSDYTNGWLCSVLLLGLIAWLWKASISQTREPGR